MFANVSIYRQKIKNRGCAKIRFLPITAINCMTKARIAPGFAHCGYFILAKSARMLTTLSMPTALEIVMS